MNGQNKLTLAERIANRERVISGEFYVDKTGYLHHTHCDVVEAFEIMYLLHEDF